MRRHDSRSALDPRVSSPARKAAPGASSSTLFPANKHPANGHAAPDRFGSPISGRAPRARDADFTIARSLSLSSDADGSDESGSLHSEPTSDDRPPAPAPAAPPPPRPGGARPRDKAAVQVCVRIRPMEVSGGERPREGVSPKVCWRYDARSIAPAAAAPYGGGGADGGEGGQSFTFDNIFPPMTRTDEIYRPPPPAPPERGAAR
jgi:hypothetical protein